MEKETSEPTLRRISLMIREDQHRALTDQDLNVSGLVRDLIDDYLSEHKITIAVGEKTRSLYDQIVANTGSTDVEVEVYFREALKHLLNDKIKAMQKLEERIREK
jgi:hypothetical protein